MHHGADIVLLEEKHIIIVNASTVARPQQAS